MHRYPPFGLLICTLISENQGLEKLRSDSNFRKISGPCNPGFLLVCHLDFFHFYGMNLFFLGGDRKKNPDLKDLKSFTGLKQTLILQDLDFKTLIFRNQGAD